MEPPLYMRSVVDWNTVMQRIPIHLCFIPIFWIIVQIKCDPACCWHFKYFQFGIMEKNGNSYKFWSSVLSSCLLTVLWLENNAGRMESCFLLTPSLCSEEWLFVHVKSDCKFRTLISRWFILWYWCCNVWNTEQMMDWKFRYDADVSEE